MTALGTLRLRRGYVVASDGGQFPADSALGIDGYLTNGAQRMAVFAGVRDSFAHAQQVLRELCGWNLDDDTIRKVTHATARRATTTREERVDGEGFQQAPGVVEAVYCAPRTGHKKRLGELEWTDVQHGFGNPKTAIMHRPSGFRLGVTFSSAPAQRNLTALGPDFAFDFGPHDASNSAGVT